jgi:hypothetical protein
MHFHPGAFAFPQHYFQEEKRAQLNPIGQALLGCVVALINSGHNDIG